MNNISDIRKQYGENVFRLAITHLFEVGINQLSDIDVEAECEQIIKTTPQNSIFTGELSADIMRCAAELAKVPLWDILKFIKTDVGIDSVTVHPGMIIEFRQNATEDFIMSRIASGVVTEEMIDEIEKSVATRMEEYEEKHHGSCYGFSYEEMVDKAFREAGVRLTAVKPDKIIYL